METKLVQDAFRIMHRKGRVSLVLYAAGTLAQPMYRCTAAVNHSFILLSSFLNLTFYSAADFIMIFLSISKYCKLSFKTCWSPMIVKQVQNEASE